VAPP
jgi:hypothetical protein